MNSADIELEITYHAALNNRTLKERYAGTTEWSDAQREGLGSEIDHFIFYKAVVSYIQEATSQGKKIVKLMDVSR